MVTAIKQAFERTVKGNIQDRLIAPCATVQTTPSSVSVSTDIPALLNRLLLFEDYFLQSIRLKEFESLVPNLGLENVLLLLDSGALKIDLNPTQFGQTGQTARSLGIREKEPLPLLSYSFSLIRSPYENDYLVRSVEEVHHALFDVHTRNDLMKLEGAILRAVMPIPEDAGGAAILAFDSDLKVNSPIFRTALLSRLRLMPNFTAQESDVSLTIRPIDDTDYVVETNLESFGLTKEETHKTVESSLLAAGYLNRRIEDMENYNALSGVIDDELFLLGQKLKVLAGSVSPKGKEETFDKVLRIGHFPSFDFQPPTKQFDMEKFLKIRDSKECRAFRDWLKRAQFLDEREIHLQVGSLRARLGTLVHGTTGKIIRFALSNVAGLNPVTGLAVGALDTFIVEKLLPLSGPAMFLDAMYGSLFDQNKAVGENEGK
jgi:hypothetical protein